MAKAGKASTDEYRELNEMLEVTTEKYSELKE
jgi:hypothetical protein